MAEIVEADKPQKGKKKKPKKLSTHVDMTPMVDLICLLITFFMLTTAFNKPKIMEIVLPEKIKKEDKKQGKFKIPFKANGKTFQLYDKDGQIILCEVFKPFRPERKNSLSRLFLSPNPSYHLRNLISNSGAKCE